MLQLQWPGGSVSPGPFTRAHPEIECSPVLPPLTPSYSPSPTLLCLFGHLISSTHLC